MKNIKYMSVVSISVVLLTLFGILAFGFIPNPLQKSVTLVEPPQDEIFWNTLRINGSEVNHFKSIAEMTGGSDLVAIGHLTNFRKSREIQDTEALENVVTYTAVDLVIDEVLYGEAPGSTIPVEFLFPYEPHEVSTLVKAQRSRMPKDEVLMFLNHKGGEEEGLYCLAEFRGLVISDKKGKLRTPLAQAPVIYSSAPAPFPAEASQEYEEDRAFVEEGLRNGTIDKPLPGLVASIRGGQQRDIDNDDQEEEVVESLNEELESKKSVEDVATLVRRIRKAGI